MKQDTKKYKLDFSQKAHQTKPRDVYSVVNDPRKQSQTQNQKIKDRKQIKIKNFYVKGTQKQEKKRLLIEKCQSRFCNDELDEATTNEYVKLMDKYSKVWAMQKEDLDCQEKECPERLVDVLMDLDEKYFSDLGEDDIEVDQEEEEAKVEDSKVDI